MKKLLRALKNIYIIFLARNLYPSILPPCKQSLVLHLKRANYIAKLWKSCLIPRIEFPDITEHGWKSNGDILWTTNEFPDRIVELLASTENVDFQDETVYFSEEESDDD